MASAGNNIFSHGLCENNLLANFNQPQGGFNQIKKRPGQNPAAVVCKIGR